MMHRLFNTTALITMTVLVIGCGKSEGPKGDENGKQGKSIDQSTPEKVLESFKKAANNEDWTSAFACMTAESQVAFIKFVVVDAALTAGADKSKSFKSLIKKHGFELDQEPDFMSVDDKPALFGDLISWMKQNSEKKEESFSMVLAKTEFTNFKIEGDTATADTGSKTNGKDSEKIHFVRTNEKWYLNFAETIKSAFAKKPASKKTPVSLKETAIGKWKSQIELDDAKITALLKSLNVPADKLQEGLKKTKEEMSAVVIEVEVLANGSYVATTSGMGPKPDVTKGNWEVVSEQGNVLKLKTTDEGESPHTTTLTFKGKDEYLFSVDDPEFNKAPFNTPILFKRVK